MIANIIFYIIGGIGTAMTGWLPGGDKIPLQLPWGLDSLLVGGVASYKLLAKAFPPFDTILIAFGVLVAFKIAVRLLKAVPLLGKTLS